MVQFLCCIFPIKNKQTIVLSLSLSMYNFLYTLECILEIQFNIKQITLDIKIIKFLSIER